MQVISTLLKLSCTCIADIHTSVVSIHQNNLTATTSVLLRPTVLMFKWTQTILIKQCFSWLYKNFPTVNVCSTLTWLFSVFVTPEVDLKKWIFSGSNWSGKYPKLICSNGLNDLCLQQLTSCQIWNRYIFFNKNFAPDSLSVIWLQIQRLSLDPFCNVFTHLNQ